MALNPTFVHTLKQLQSLSVWLTILVVIFVPLERYLAVHAHKTLRKGIGTDLGYFFINSLVPALLLSIPIAILAKLVRHLVPGGVFAFTASLPFWALAIAGLVVSEVGGYWGHRWSHEIPFLWRFHSVHHSSEDMDFLVNTRGHPLDMVFGQFCGLVPMYILGLGGPTAATGGSNLVLLILLIGKAWGFFLHANLRVNLGPLEWIIATPKFHHWHHTKTGAIDHNYASMLPWIDRIFGTLHLPKRWPKSYGIDAKLPDTLVGQLTYPLLPAESAAVRPPETAVVEQPAEPVSARD